MSEGVYTTFLDAFDPPAGLVGTAAVFVTMTADAVVLDAALTRFTRHSGRRRQRSGRCCAYLMRDLAAVEHAAPTFGPRDIPGLHELREKPNRGGRLLHAKLAVLGFAERPESPPTHARLVVSTGNFRKGGLRRLLDLVFVCETTLGREADRDALADLKAAAKFVRALGEERFQVAAELAAGDRNPLDGWSRLLDPLANARTQGTEPRFFHSLATPLMTQLAKRVEALGGEPRNFALCASGFYEQIGEGADPEILNLIAEWSALSVKATRHLMVNPAVSGQLHEAQARIAKARFETPVRATDPREKGRTLHAKLILLGRARGEGARLQIRDAHLYLGSGNLTRHGMMQGPEKGGNIEAGVFFAVEGRLDAERLRETLFWDPSARPIDDSEWKMLAPSTGERRTARPCPVLHVRASADGCVLLVWAPGAEEGISVELPSGDTVHVGPGAQIDTALAASGAFAVAVRATSDGTRWEVPVIDPSGRYGWDPPAIRSATELLQWISEPALLDECDDPDDPDATDDAAGAGGSAPTSRATSAPRPRERRYPLLELARLVEGLARRFQALEGGAIDAAIDELEWWSDLPLPAELVAEWRASPIAVMHHLRDPVLAPAGMRVKQRERYLLVLARLESRWGLR